MAKKKEPPLEAVALEYDPKTAAPKVVASGRGYVAERIVDEARGHNVPIHKDPELAHTLNLLKVGDEIPPELYSVVAQILVYVGDVDKLRGIKE